MQRFRYDRVRGSVSEFDIYIRSFDPDHPESPETGLQRVFGFGEERARAFVDAVPRMVKRGVPAAQVERYERALAEVGALYELRQAPIKPQQIMVVVGGDTGAREDEGGDTLTLPPPADPEPQPVIGMQATVVGAAPPGSPTSTRGGGDSARTAVDASARRGADDPDRTAAAMTDAGAEVVISIDDRPWGKREGRVADPHGHLWILSKPIEEVSDAEIRRRLGETD